MRRAAVAFLAGGAVVAVALFTWGLAAGAFVVHPSPASTLFVAGQVVEVQAPGGLDVAPVVSFTVSPAGGTFVGSVQWNDSHAAFLLVPDGAIVNCTAEFFTLNYSGPPWTQSWNESLSPGVWYFGAICGGYGAATVTESIQLVYPSA
jgi:hypothetical protein